MRRQGVRAEGLLKDSDNLIQRYRNLSVRLQEQAEAQSVLQQECEAFSSQAESTRTWIAELLKPLSGPDTQSEEMNYRAQVSDGEVQLPLVTSLSLNLRLNIFLLSSFREIRNPNWF